MSKVKVTGNENVKIILFFAHIFFTNGSTYVKRRPKWSAAHSFYTYRRIHFTSKNVSFLR